MPIPDVVDLTPHVPAARDQGRRETCIAFAVTCAHEHARHDAVALSEDALYWACKMADGDWNGGTTFSSAEQAVLATGQSVATVWPYNLSHPEGTPLVPPVGVVPDTTWRRAALTAVDPTETGVCAALADGQVVILGVELTPQWHFVDASGIFQPLIGGEQIIGLHAVAAVGYDRTSGALRVRNSWGAGWARDGCAVIPFAYFRHVLEAWTAPDHGLVL